MKNLTQSLLILLTALIPGASSSHAAEAIALQTDVFVSGADGYAAYRIPALAAAPDGTLLAFAEARKYNLSDPGGKGNDIDLVLKRSTDGGRTWSAMQVIEDPGEYWSAGNPAPVVDRQTRRIFVHYLQCKPGRGSHTARPGTDDILNLYRTSDDNGRTWSAPVDITTASRDMKDMGWRVSVFGPAGAIQDRTGRLLVPVWRADKPWRVFAVFSEDHGKTWQRGEPVPGLEGDESQFIELAAGKILVDVRQQKGPRRWFAESADGGRTWGAPREGLTVTPCCCSIIRDPASSAGEGSGRILWTGPRGPGRKTLVLRASADEGKTFPIERVISEEPAAYSSLAPLPDGCVAVLWERGNYKYLTLTILTRAFMESAR